LPERFNLESTFFLGQLRLFGRDIFRRILQQMLHLLLVFFNCMAT
jgi:hypothetical protein